LSSLPILVFVVFILGRHGYISVAHGVNPAWEVENVTVLASVWEDAEDLIFKGSLLEGELAKAH
jgi:hypothetical protein